VGHFISRAHDIMAACDNAYMESVQDVDEFDESGIDPRMPNKGCFELLKISLAGHMEVLVKEFIRIGAKNSEKFLDESIK
jgi:ubiquitin-conjugating enzyme E2 O